MTNDNLINQLSTKSNELVLFEGLLRILEGSDHQAIYALMSAAEGVSQDSYPHKYAKEFFPKLKYKDDKELRYASLTNAAKTIYPEDLDAFKAHVAKAIEDRQALSYLNSDLTNSLQVARMINGSDAELQFMSVLFALENHHNGDNFKSAILAGGGLDAMTLALHLSGEDPKKTKLVKPTSPIVKSGLVVVKKVTTKDEDGDEITIDPPALNKTFTDPVAVGYLMDSDQIAGAFLGEPQSTDLDLSDFAFLDQEEIGAKTLASYIRGLDREDLVVGRKPNIIILGPPGTGKSELARAVAAATDKKLYAVAELRSGGTAYSGAERLQRLEFLKTICANRKDVLLMLDEAEGVIPNPKAGRDEERTAPKILINRVIESTVGPPVLWITNGGEQFEAAFRRRFGISLEVDAPLAPEFLENVWSRLGRRYGLDLKEETIRQLVQVYPDAVPGYVDNALSYAATITEPGKEFSAAAVEVGLRNVMRSVDGTSRAGYRTSPIDRLPFDCYNGADWNGRDLTESVASYVSQAIASQDAGVNSMPVMLIGGTVDCGQNQMAQTVAAAVAQATERKIIRIESPLLAKPEIISGYFDKAYDDRAVLVIDDTGMSGDNSLLGDNNAILREVLRRSASQRQVPLLIVTRDTGITTPVEVDYRVELIPPSPDQASALMRTLYNIPVSEVQANKLAWLATGEYLTVARQMEREGADFEKAKDDKGLQEAIIARLEALAKDRRPEMPNAWERGPVRAAGASASSNKRKAAPAATAGCGDGGCC